MILLVLKLHLEVHPDPRLSLIGETAAAPLVPSFCTTEDTWKTPIHRFLPKCILGPPQVPSSPRYLMSHQIWAFSRKHVWCKRFLVMNFNDLNWSCWRYLEYSRVDNFDKSWSEMSFAWTEARSHEYRTASLPTMNTALLQVLQLALQHFLEDPSAHILTSSLKNCLYSILLVQSANGQPAAFSFFGRSAISAEINTYQNNSKHVYSCWTWGIFGHVPARKSLKPSLKTTLLIAY